MANQINIVITAQDKASKPIRAVANEMDNASGGSNKFGAALAATGRIALGVGAAGFAAVTTGAIAASKAAFDQVKAVEEARYGLMAYEKDGQKVNQVLNALVGYAQSDAGVLFNRADLFAAASTLKMYGNETETLTERVKILSKGVAMGKTSFQELSAIVGRAAAKGRLDAVDFDMLIERGIGIDRKFRGATVSAQELYAELNRALPDEILKGRANTIEGRMVRLQSAFRSVGNAIIGVDATSNELIKGGLGDRFIQGMEGVTQILKTIAPVVRTLTADVLRFSDEAVANAIRSVGWLNDRFREIPGVVQGAIGWIRDGFSNAFKVSKDAVANALGAIKKTAEDTWSSFTGWVEENKTAITTVATVLGVVFGPALLRATVLAAVAGIKIAASGVAAGGGWVLGSIKATAAWLLASAKWVVASSIASVKMVGHAVAVSVAHSVHAVKSTLVWTVQFAKMVLTSSVSAVQMSAHASSVGWAWVFNATRISFVWVTQELPKIVVATLATSIAASRHALATSAAWIASATRTAVAWVITELPRIVSGFVLTSASAGTHALATSAAWIASASRTAIAWVITELPKIIASFIAVTASAVAQSALTTGAWVASATTSSAAFTALRLLVSTPMVMPAIAVAAAIGALVLVQQAADRARNAVEEAANIKQAAHDEDMRMIGIINQQYKSGQISKEKHTQMLKIVGKASGTNSAPGGWTLVGEHGPEPVYLPQGASVTPTFRARQGEGMGGGGHTVIIENLHNNYPNDQGRLIRDIGFALELA